MYHPGAQGATRRNVIHDLSLIRLAIRLLGWLRYAVFACYPARVRTSLMVMTATTADAHRVYLADHVPGVRRLARVGYWPQAGAAQVDGTGAGATATRLVREDALAGRAEAACHAKSPICATSATTTSANPRNPVIATSLQRGPCGATSKSYCTPGDPVLSWLTRTAGVYLVRVLRRTLRGGTPVPDTNMTTELYMHLSMGVRGAR